ncbi:MULTISPECIES: hypothetical protein [Clavibacter]|uniref:Stress protein n=1 Tax=Clavibacter tessellarius TaxID=31965 RepID=A0A154UZP0_9MICO|nr:MULTISPECIES: hypothetical protein [Clavibacter]KZC94571.1 hypothetical protein AWH51_12720 [Clavibacter michiganensis subsp. tessellarius]MDA3804873.1 hypothetical protein [Clavibacter sp. CT19]
MSKLTSTTTRIAATAALGGGMIAALGGFAAAPALAAEAPAPDPKTSAATSPITGSVTLDPVAIVNAINVAVNDQRDRNGAVQAALDVGYYNAGNPDRLTVAVVNKNQDIYVEGAIADAKPIAIKGGSYVIYWFNGPGKVTNNGDGGFLNWGVLGNSVKNGNVISINGG